jgi:hypothetical protein
MPRTPPRVAAFPVAVVGADRGFDWTRTAAVRSLVWLVATTGIAICLAGVIAGILVMTDN